MALNGKPAPSPAPLAVPTDLSPKEVAAVVEALNHLVACSLACYIKAKNYHWHVAGPHFRGYHKLFDKCASHLEHQADSLAERIRRIGGTTIHSAGEVAQLSRIADDNDLFVQPAAMAYRLMQDFGFLAQDMRDAIGVAEANRDKASEDKLESWLAKIEKRKWALFEITQLTGYTPPVQ